jgi:hypothetical protein
MGTSHKRILGLHSHTCMMNHPLGAKDVIQVKLGLLTGYYTQNYGLQCMINRPLRAKPSPQNPILTSRPRRARPVPQILLISHPLGARPIL